MHRPERWTARDLVPSATAQESTSPLPQVTSGGGSPLRLKLAPVSRAEVRPENPNEYPVAAGPEVKTDGQSGLNQSRTPNVPAIRRERGAKSSAAGQSRSAPIQRIISTLVARAGAIRKSVRNGAGLPAAPPDKEKFESLGRDRGLESSDHENFAEGPGIGGAVPDKPFAFLQLLKPRAGRNSAAPAAAAPGIEDPERRRAAGVEEGNPLAEDRGPRHRSPSGEPERVRLLVRGTRAIESAGEGLLLLSRHFVQRRGGHSPQATGPEWPVEASPEANFQPSMPRTARPVVASEGDEATAKVRAISEQDAPSGEPPQSFRLGTRLGSFLTHSKIARMVRPSPSLNRLSGEKGGRVGPPSGRPFGGPPVPGGSVPSGSIPSGRRLISRPFLAVSRIRSGLSSALTFREGAPNRGQPNTSTPEISAGAVDNFGTHSRNNPLSGESPARSAPPLKVLTSKWKGGPASTGPDYATFLTKGQLLNSGIGLPMRLQGFRNQYRRGCDLVRWKWGPVGRLLSGERQCYSAGP